MLKDEILRINRSLTTPQRDVLVMLDGKIGPLELNGTYSRTLNSLREKGLIHVSSGTKYVQYGTARPGWNLSRKVFRVRLSTVGAAFIYNGGIDF